MLELKQLASGSLKGWLAATRLPITVAERITGRESDPTWGPALLFDSFAARMKVAGAAILRDDDLMREANLHQTKVDKAKEAERSRVLAEVQRAEADRKVRQERARLEREQRQAEQQAEQRRAQAEERRRKGQAAAAQAEAKRKQDARRKAAAKTQSAQTRRESARQGEIATELEGVRAAEATVRAKAKVARIDDAIEDKKRKRKQT